MALSRTVSEIWPVIGSKSQNSPPSHLGPSIGVTPMEFWESVTDPETRVLGGWWRFDDPSLHRLCLIHQCDRQTDRQTELRWLSRAIAVPAVARKTVENERRNRQILTFRCSAAAAEAPVGTVELVGRLYRRDNGSKSPRYVTVE